MSDNYKNAAEGVKRFLERVSAESVEISAKIIAYADRMGRITQRENPAEFDAIIKGMAADLELFADRIDDLLPEYRRNLELLTEGFVERNKSLDPTTDAGAQELKGMRVKAQGLAETASGNKTRITALRGALTSLRDKDYDHRLTASAHRVISTVDDAFMAFEDLETFALKVSFSADQK